ncbi:MAG: protein kinase [Acidobacteria bacterium]|nr:protein kinase [Acidobacteriota bacterium]
MALNAGTRIGPYEIVAPLGEGGMGEVYRARDTRLGRDVAIKVLPSAVAQDTDRLARFDREARTLAALNHPGIAQIYGVEQTGTDAGAIRALVMELVEGPTLADRIVQGAIPPDEALAIAKQIAEALEAAHEHNIIHRDLKPANIKLRPDGAVKLLDFGLAKAFGPDQSPQADISQAPTVTSPPAPFYWHSGTMTQARDVTQAGMILGTAAYMAPEQASGKPVDKRADIWAFGVVLWEMLAGRRLFEGETISHVLAAVLTKEPDMTAVPSHVRTLVSRCLEKDARKRLRDIGDAMSLVQDTPASLPVAAPRRWIHVGGWVAAALTIAVLAVAAWLRPAAVADVDSPVARFSVERSADIYSNSSLAFAVSPDGLLLAYYGPVAGGQQALFVRTLATGDVREVPGSTSATIRASSLFWSPDGRELVQGTASSTNVIDVTTGVARPLCDCRFSGGSWNGDVILLGSLPVTPGGIRRLSATERTTVEITQPDVSSLEQDQWPVFLPDGRQFLFTRTGSGGEVATWLGTLDGGTPRRVADGSQRVFVPASGSRRAYLLGIDGAGLVAQPFDVNTLSVTDEPELLVPGAVAVSASNNGVLATSRVGRRPPFVPAWFDRKGMALGQVGEAGSIQSVALSPDGRKLAVDQFGAGPGAPSSDIWVRDVAGGFGTRLTFDPDNNSAPVWTPDGTRIIFSALQNGVQRLQQRRVDGTGNETPLVELSDSAWINDWSSDDRWAIFSLVRRDTAFNDLWVVPVENGVARTPVPYIQGPARQQQAQFSPDGRFVAYGSDQTGTFEIYVQPFPNAVDGKWMISNGGGSEPRWSRDGRELYYFSGQTLMAVPVRLQPTFSSGAAVALFTAPVLSNYTNDGHRWQVAPDGKRFLLLTSAGKDEAPPLEVLVNWPSLLNR